MTGDDHESITRFAISPVSDGSGMQPVNTGSPATGRWPMHTTRQLLASDGNVTRSSPIPCPDPARHSHDIRPLSLSRRQVKS
ncbi:hypothetical protein BCR44DRAFT_1441674 [Catenaria anguillulae PL171]|uniref:Uncharacterized protein n=2 Tax=Catenaria anguillulae PL171 TaxID=765915 RepID=A0A1Y2HB62_9FUNG|nr:hypothetical protein BCR44DRAFT_1441674 [Catenaria anguillulae PL171]